jgi:hypothetical protein
MTVGASSDDVCRTDSFISCSFDASRSNHVP